MKPNGGGAELTVERHAPHGAVKQGHTNIQKPLGPAGRPPDLEGQEPHTHLGAVARPCRRRNKVANKNPDGADVIVAEPVLGVDVDHDGGGVGPEEFIVDPEDELVVPGGVVMAGGVDAGGEFTLWVDPGDGVSPHGTGDQGKILGGDEIDLQELQRTVASHCRNTETGKRK